MARIKLHFEVAALSDKGRVRHGNEDACGHSVDAGGFVLCDGMGGAAAGEIASHLAVETFLAAIHGTNATGTNAMGTDGNSPQVAPADEDAKPGSGAPMDLDAAPDRLRAAIFAANRAVLSRALEHPELRGMGTTLVALMFEETTDGHLAWIAHAGDSRCYLLRGGELRQLTVDHSLVEEQVRMGQLTLEEAERSPWRSVITRAVGSANAVEPEITGVAVNAGDLYLLCSDGLTRELTDAEIGQVMRSESGIEATCERLVGAANANGGHDNITVMLVRAG